MNTTPCTNCGHETNVLDLFPNQICLVCYEQKQIAREKEIGHRAYMAELANQITNGFGK